MQFAARQRLNSVKIARLVLPHKNTNARVYPADRIDKVKRDIKAFLEPVIRGSLHHLEGARLLLARSRWQRNICPTKRAARTARQPDAFVNMDETIRLVVPFPRCTGRSDIERDIGMGSSDVEKAKRSETVRFNDRLKGLLQHLVAGAVLYCRDCFVDFQIKTPPNLGMSKPRILLQASIGSQEISGD